MTVKNRSTVRRIVREEFTKRVLGEAANVPPRFAKVWQSLPRGDWAAFGKWVRGKFAQSIPADVEDKDVVEFLDKNPATSRLTPVQLVDMFRALPSIRKGLNSYGDDEIERLDQAVKGDTKYQRGETSLKKTGDALGVTDAGAKQIGDKAQDYFKKFYGTAGHPEDLDNDAFVSLFGPGGKFDAAVNKAAELYSQMLVAARGDVDKVFDLLKTAGALQKDEAGSLSDAERVAVSHLGDLAAQGKTDVVKQLLKRDIDKDLNDSNVVKSFQNLVSRLIRKDIDAADIAAGVKRGRGRPKGSTNKK